MPYHKATIFCWFFTPSNRSSSYFEKNASTLNKKLTAIQATDLITSVVDCLSPKEADLEANTSMGCTNRSLWISWTMVSTTHWRERLFLQSILINYITMSSMSLVRNLTRQWNISKQAPLIITCCCFLMMTTKHDPSSKKLQYCWQQVCMWRCL